MSEEELRQLIAEVIVLRGTTAYREEEEKLIASGAVLNSQVGGADIQQRCAQLREMAPGPLTLQCDLETGSAFAADGLAVPPLMALGAAREEQLAYEWGYAIGLEGRRLGLDLTWSPVLDINTNPDNPIINVRSFGEDVELVCRLGPQIVRGMSAAGLEPCAKHWPGHGDVAVDSHIALPTVPLSWERLEAIEWAPYRAARAAGLESVMTAHLLVPAIDPENCATVSPTLIGILRQKLGFPGPLITDSMGMEGLRQTLDSAEAAWRALAAGHDQILIDYKRSPLDAYQAVWQACWDGRVPEQRLREAAACVRRLKARRTSLPHLPPASEIRHTLEKMGRRVAEAAVTFVQTGERAASIPGLFKLEELGTRPLAIICDDLTRRSVALAAEQEERGLHGQHPLAGLLQAHLGCETIVLNEALTEADLARVQEALLLATGVIGATFAHIVSYKGEGVRLPKTQQELWRRVAQSGKLRGMLLFESPYALFDLPSGWPVIVSYGADMFSLQASFQALLGQQPCPGKLPVAMP